MAASKSQGTLEAPSTSTDPSSLPTPSICTKNSVLTRRAESDSPSCRLPHKESTSSIKIMARLPGDSRAISNRFLTSFSDSPCHLEIKSALLTEKNVESASVATALAKKDLPVPGGPNNRIPLNGRRSPTNNCGNLTGIITVSFRLSLALSNPATSSHRTFGFSDTTAPARAPRNLTVSSSFFSSFFSSLPSPPSPSFPPSAPPLFFSGELGLFSLSRIPRNSSARFMYPSTFSMTIFLRVGFFSYLIPMVNRSRASLYKLSAVSCSPLSSASMAFWTTSMAW
mmetsp:Transcript_20418/g.50048  ORF Transcript_20418/g.50048 Transcript_20418/m.50048 type:complete len:283 (-) Transcript_20418:280-1128(-)